MKTHEKIRSIRLAQNLTQEEMAEKLDLSTNSYSKLEQGKTKIDIERILQIANIFNIDVADLLKEGGDFNVLLGDNYTNFLNHSNHQEIERLQLIIAYKDEVVAHKDELLTQKDNEIALLRRLLGE